MGLMGRMGSTRKIGHSPAYESAIVGHSPAYSPIAKPMKFILTTLLTLTLIASTNAERMPKADVVEVPAVHEGLYFHHLFQSDMVLQRDQPIDLWGWATPGESLTVTLDGDTQKTTAAKDGKWKATFSARPASADPINASAQGSKSTIALKNILLGDVWVLGGQSNMEFEIAKVENGALEIASANYPQIRILTVPYGEGPDYHQNFPRLHQWSDWSGRHFRKGDWDVCTPEIVRELSAIGYVFARRIHMASQVPIGVIDASRGGTTIEAWAPKSALQPMKQESVKNMLAEWDQKVADYDPKADLEKQISRYHSKVEKIKKQGKEVPADMKLPTEPRPGPGKSQHYPGNCYAGMIAPLEGLRVKGAIFHQGFNNCFSGTEGTRMYRDVFPEMITAWRKAFQNPEMPFGILSLCTAGMAQTEDNYSESMRDAGAYIREAQYQTFLEFYKAGDKNIGFSSTYDLRRRWYHPQLKVPAGERIARWALATQYGFEKSLRWKPAMIEEMTVKEGQITLRFDGNVGPEDSGHPIYGFAIAGADRKFHPAKTTHLVTGKDSRGREQKDKKALVLSSPMVPQPEHYRFAWARNPLANLESHHNTDIPLATQRSDDWPLESVPLALESSEKPLSKGQIKKTLQAIDLERRLHEAHELIKEHKKP